MSSESPNHLRSDSITSPGLDALAAAASNSAPLASPPLQYQNSHHLKQKENNLVGIDVRGQEQQIYSSGLEQLSEAAAGIRGDGWDKTAFMGAKAEGLGLGLGLKMEGDATDGAATSQIREPLPGPDANIPAALVPETQSEQVVVKTEIGDAPIMTPQQSTSQQVNGQFVHFPPDIESLVANIPRQAVPDTKSEEATMSAADVKPEMPSIMPSPKPTSKAPPKKRAAPKKGTASTLKPAAKKRKLDTSGSAEVSPVRAPSVTSRASATPVPKNRKQDSTTPTRSSSVAMPDDDEASGSDSNEVFCICRKPDDHRVMIGCDGPCDDWFHLNCVGMTEAKTKLVQKWFCPNCTEQGNATLWKRMCRLPGCENPARLEDTKNLSKYCSEEHGEEFFRRMIQKVGGVGSSTGLGWGVSDFVKPPASSNTRRKTQASQQHLETIVNGNGHVEGQEEETETRGGVLKVSELKALLDSVNDVSEFYRLGEGVDGDHPGSTTYDDLDTSKYTQDELDELDHIIVQKSKLLRRKDMLDDREKFVEMVEARHKAVWAQMKERGESGKEICGYDSRLTWSEEEFESWRTSAEGQAALSSAVLPPPSAGPPDFASSATVVNGTAPGSVEDAGKMPNGVNGSTEGDEEDDASRGACKEGFPKKRCERHRAWLRREQQDNAFERNQTKLGIRKLEADEKGIKDRARIRMVEAQGEETEVNGIHENEVAMVNGTS